MSVEQEEPAACTVCAHIAAHGWIGPRAASHCRRCHRSWKAKGQSHCTGCCEHFSSPSAADLHLRVHDRGERVEHLDPGSLRNGRTGVPSLVRVSDYYGELWAHPGEHPAALVGDGSPVRSEPA